MPNLTITYDETHRGIALWVQTLSVIVDCAALRWLGSFHLVFGSCRHCRLWVGLRALCRHQVGRTDRCDLIGAWHRPD